MSDVRPFEEYKEMIKDMRKEEMIKGLYDLSARITEQDKEIERLTAESTKWESKCYNYQDIIKEVRELVENGTDFKCITFRKADEDTWKLILASHIKEDFLEILDKENMK